MLRRGFGDATAGANARQPAHIQRLGTEAEGADAVLLAELLAPLANGGVLLHLVEASRPRFVVPEQEGEHGKSGAYRVLVLHLGNAEHFPFRHISATEGDQQNTQTTAVDPLSGEVFGLAVVRRPVFHRVDMNAALAQCVDDTGAVFLQVEVRRGDESPA